MKLTEQNFIQQMLWGNEKALEYAMIHYGGLVKSVVHRILYQLPQYEEECINDVFFAVWNNISAYQPQRNPFANWIAGVARIKALDYKRNYARQLLETSYDAWTETGGGIRSSSISHLSKEIEQLQDEFSDETNQMLSCLKPQDQELFMRLYVEEQTVDQVSQDSGISKPVIYNRVSRAKKKLRNLFSSESETASS